MKTTEQIYNSCICCMKNNCGPHCAYYYGEDPADCRKLLLKDASDVIGKIQKGGNESAVNTYWGNICDLNARQEKKA